MGRAAGCAILLPESSDRDMIPDEQAGQAGKKSAAREPVSVVSGWLRVDSPRCIAAQNVCTTSVTIRSLKLTIN